MVLRFGPHPAAASAGVAASAVVPAGRLVLPCNGEAVVKKQSSSARVRHLRLVESREPAFAKRKNTKPNYQRILLLAFFIALLVWAVYPVRYRIEQRKELSKLQAEVGNLRTENAGLRHEIAQLQSDEYVEKLARERLGLVKPGEEPVIVISGEEKTALQQPERQEEQPSFWGRLYSFFAGLLR